MTEGRKQGSGIRKTSLTICRLIPVLCLLSACGWHPVYGNLDAGDAPVAAEMNAVAIDGIPDRIGQDMRNDLIDRMYGKGRPAQPRYHLVITLRYTEEDLGIQADLTSTRSELNMTGDFVLNDNAGNQILKGTSHSVSNFNKLDDQYATLVARQEAYERTLNECSEQIVNRLSLFFAQQPTEAAAKAAAASTAPAKAK